MKMAAHLPHPDKILVVLMSEAAEHSWAFALGTNIFTITKVCLLGCYILNKHMLETSLLFAASYNFHWFYKWIFKMKR
jgi:hypothetical protein